ncbi:MAG: hypothetical protein NUW01_03730 [Gemmatimonadaceae bacterium]|nr:hypothetical protein [Gemmatimonadaceae bacterium]
MTRDEVVARFSAEWQTAGEAGLDRRGGEFWSGLVTALVKGLLDRRLLGRNDPRKIGGTQWEYRRAQPGRVR